MEDKFWQEYQNRGVQVIGIDVWNGSVSAVQNFAQGGGRNITFPLGMRAGSVGNQYGLDRHSFVIVDASNIIQYISPQSTPYTQRLTRHEAEMIAKIEELIAITSVYTPSAPFPEAFQLYQNSPNPFTTHTQFRFDLSPRVNQHRARLVVYDLLGRTVRTIVEGHLGSGSHIFRWDGRDDRGNSVPTGVYFYVLRSGNLRATKKMLYISKESN